MISIKQYIPYKHRSTRLHANIYLEYITKDNVATHTKYITFYILLIKQNCLSVAQTSSSFKSLNTHTTPMDHTHLYN